MSDTELADVLRPLVRELLAKGVPPAEARQIAMAVVRAVERAVRAELAGHPTAPKR